VRVMALGIPEIILGLRLTTGQCLSNIGHDLENNECDQKPVRFQPSKVNAGQAL
jgi:hypothetical protein